MEHIARISSCGSKLSCVPNLFDYDTIDYFVRESKGKYGTYMYQDRMWILSATSTGYEILIYSMNKIFTSSVITISSQSCLNKRMRRNVSLEHFDEETIRNTKMNTEIPVYDTQTKLTCNLDDEVSFKELAFTVLEFVSTCAMKLLTRR